MGPKLAICVCRKTYEGHFAKQLWSRIELEVEILQQGALVVSSLASWSHVSGLCSCFFKTMDIASTMLIQHVTTHGSHHTGWLRSRWAASCRKSMLFLLMGGGGSISQNFERGTKVEEGRSVAPSQPRLKTKQIENETPGWIVVSTRGWISLQLSGYTTWYHSTLLKKYQECGVVLYCISWQ